MAQTAEVLKMKKKDDDAPKVNWDESRMKTAYANVCNVLSTREEVTLLFGTRQTWHANKNQLDVKLSDRLILTPFAAKRLLLLCKKILSDYESRFGKLDMLEPGGPK